MRFAAEKSLSLSGFIRSHALYSGSSNDPGATKKMMDSDDLTIGSGKFLSQERKAGSFTGIQVTGVARVVITQDTVETLHVEADDNVVNRVTTSVNGGVLVVGLQGGTYRDITVNVFATMKTIDRLEASGNAEFVSTAPLQMDGILCRITGAGRITLAGSAANEAVEVTGAGEVHNLELHSLSCVASISGSGVVEVSVSGDLDAAIFGTGSIFYAGNPRVIHRTITGIGSVRRKQLRGRHASG